MKYLIIVIAMFFSGCSFLEVRVEVGQRSVLDNGNHKQKKIADDNSDLDKDETKTIIKTIP